MPGARPPNPPLRTSKSAAAALIAGVALWLVTGRFFVVIAIAIAVLLGLVYLVRSRRSRRQAPQLVHDSIPHAKSRRRTITMEPDEERDPGVPAWFRVVGGANTPARSGGRLSSTFPLAVLTLENGTLTLRLRPHILMRLFGAPRPLCIVPTDPVTFFPAHERRFGGRAIGLELPVSAPYYFFCRTRDWQQWILDVLRGNGFQAEHEEREFRAFPYSSF